MRTVFFRLGLGLAALLAFAPATVPAQDTGVVSPVPLDGTWFGSTVDEPGFQAMAVVTGDTMVYTELVGAREPTSFTFTPVAAAGNHLTVHAAADGIAGEVHLLFRSENEAFLWVINESELAWLRRGGELPEALLGDWEVDSTRPRRSDAPMQLSVDAAQLTLTENAQARTYTVHALAPTSAATDLALLEVDGDDLVTLTFEPVESGVYLLHVSGEDDGMVAFRPGARPAWLTPSP